MAVLDTRRNRLNYHVAEATMDDRSFDCGSIICREPVIPDKDLK